MVLWPRAEFDTYAADAARQAQANAQVRALTRVFFSSAFDESAGPPGPADRPPGPARLRRPRPRAHRRRRRHPHRDLGRTGLGRLPGPARGRLRRPRPRGRCRPALSDQSRPPHVIPLRAFDATSPAPNPLRHHFPGAGSRGGGPDGPAPIPPEVRRASPPHGRHVTSRAGPRAGPARALPGAARPGAAPARGGRGRRDPRPRRAQPRRCSRPTRALTSSDWTGTPRPWTAPADRLARFGDRFRPRHCVYDQLPEALAGLGQPPVDAHPVRPGRLLDAARPRRPRLRLLARTPSLDMRMDQTAGPTAADILNTLPGRRELTRILRRYGEERFAGPIARAIVREREREPFTTSARLVELDPRHDPRTGPPHRGQPRQAHVPGAADRGERRARTCCAGRSRRP